MVNAINILRIQYGTLCIFGASGDESENGYQNAHMAELPNFVTLLSLA